VELRANFQLVSASLLYRWMPCFSSVVIVARVL
jgi:hypothetical protein